jgi:ATP synthase protein I
MTKPSPLIQIEFPVGLVMVQACMIPFVALLAWQVHSPLAAKSAAIGALIGWLGSSYAAWKSFRYGGNGQIMLAGFYSGMIGKFVIVIAGFLIALRAAQPLLAIALFVGFAAVQAMSWIYPMWGWSEQRKR